MPTTYPGDPTATQAPADPPEGDGGISVNIPIASEARSVSSIAQAFKVFADYIAFLLAPFAKASAWTQCIMRFRTSELGTRFCVDHAGFPGGSYVQHSLDWGAGEVVGASAISQRNPGATNWQAVCSIGGVSTLIRVTRNTRSTDDPGL